MKKLECVSKNLNTTREIAKALAEEILETKTGKSALVFALSGELGSGKTAFIKSLISGLGVKKKVTSPTFVISRNFMLPRKTGYKRVFHIDVYRIKKPSELGSLNTKDIFGNPENIVLVEWAEKIKSILPKSAIWIRFRHGREKTERHIAFN
jgi:tRNA threonylcarbamoyladenosine biosynthesis protein TsaE